jgi:hypothetical protein
MTDPSEWLRTYPTDSNLRDSAWVQPTPGRFEWQDERWVQVVFEGPPKTTILEWRDNQWRRWTMPDKTWEICDPQPEPPVLQ